MEAQPRTRQGRRAGQAEGSWNHAFGGDRIMFSCKQLIGHSAGYAGKRMLGDCVVDAQRTLQNKWKISYTVIY